MDWSKIPKKELEDIDWAQMSFLEVREYINDKKVSERHSDLITLQMAKFAIINGNPLKAKFLLRRINDMNTKLWPVKIRYLALIDFILENYESSYKLYNSSELNAPLQYPQICQMKLLSSIAINRTEDLESEVTKCSDRTFKSAPLNHTWTSFMVDLALNDQDILNGNHLGELNTVLSNDDSTEMWLKMGIYLGLEKQLMPQLSLLPLERFKSDETKELLAFLYYRVSNYDIALKLIADITSPNAENIRGNIYLKDKQYDLALNHFKLALGKKSNSFNALERAIPLSWIVENYKEGLNLLELKVADEMDFGSRLALSAAFKLQLDRYQDADKDIIRATDFYKGIPPKELSIIATYSALMNYQLDELEMHSDRACRKMYDGISCWLKTQVLTWDNIANRIAQDKSTYPDSTLTIESLTDTSKTVQPIDEYLIIDQEEIIRLDQEIAKHKKVFIWP